MWSFRQQPTRRCFACRASTQDNFPHTRYLLLRRPGVCERGEGRANVQTDCTGYYSKSIWQAGAQISGRSIRAKFQVAGSIAILLLPGWFSMNFLSSSAHADMMLLQIISLSHFIFSTNELVQLSCRCRGFIQHRCFSAGQRHIGPRQHSRCVKATRCHLV